MRALRIAGSGARPFAARVGLRDCAWRAAGGPADALRPRIAVQSELPARPLLNTLTRMRRTPLARCVAALMAMLVGFSAPGLAIAHGHAHHEIIEHAAHEREHQGHELSGDVALERNRSHHKNSRSAVEGSEDQRDHDHPRFCYTTSARSTFACYVVPVASPGTQAGVVLVDTAALVLITAPARASPAASSPRQPRAPPAA